MVDLLLRFLKSQFFRFGVIGVFGFVVDSAVLTFCIWVGTGRYWGRVVSYIAAATSTWFGNRHFTFKGVAKSPRGRRAEWLRFLVLNLPGGAVNYAVYAALVSHVGLVHDYPVLGVAAGSLAGLVVNFFMSKYLVFR